MIFLVLPRVFPGPLQGPQSPVNSAGLPDFRVPGRPWGLGRHLSALSGCFAAGRDMVQPMQGQLSEFESPLMKQTWTLPAAHPQDFALHSSSTASDPDAILLVVLLFLPDLSFPLPGRSLRFPPTGIPSHALHYSLPASASHPFLHHPAPLSHPVPMKLLPSPALHPAAPPHAQSFPPVPGVPPLWRSRPRSLLLLLRLPAVSSLFLLPATSPQ